MSNDTYADVARSFGKVIVDTYIGDYQGDYIALILDESTGKFTYLAQAYGSCNMCDALTDASEADKLSYRNSISNSLIWHEAKQIRSVLLTRYWEGTVEGTIDPEACAEFMRIASEALTSMGISR